MCPQTINLQIFSPRLWDGRRRRRRSRVSGKASSGVGPTFAQGNTIPRLFRLRVTSYAETSLSGTVSERFRSILQPAYFLRALAFRQVPLSRDGYADRSQCFRLSLRSPFNGEVDRSALSSPEGISGTKQDGKGGDSNRPTGSWIEGISGPHLALWFTPTHRRTPTANQKVDE